ncbi:hypothetical protein KI387_023287, partial [Taxus chinensis]
HCPYEKEPLVVHVQIPKSTVVVRVKITVGEPIKIVVAVNSQLQVIYSTDLTVVCFEWGVDIYAWGGRCTQFFWHKEAFQCYCLLYFQWISFVFPLLTSWSGHWWSPDDYCPTTISFSDVLCTATAEALAMGKIVICADHPSNEFFGSFPNCLMYKTSEEFVNKVKEALVAEPAPLSAEQQYRLSSEDATDRFIANVDLYKVSNSRDKVIGPRGLHQNLTVSSMPNINTWLIMVLLLLTIV